MAVKEGAINMLGIRARKTEKIELRRPTFLYILSCLDNAALNKEKHCEELLIEGANKRTDFRSSWKKKR